MSVTVHRTGIVHRETRVTVYLPSGATTGAILDGWYSTAGAEHYMRDVVGVREF